MGRFTAREHVWRVPGSRMLAAAGIPIQKIMLVARWGSDVVHRYIADSPLYNIAAEFRQGVSTMEPGCPAAALTDTLLDEINTDEANIQLTALSTAQQTWTRALHAATCSKSPGHCRAQHERRARQLREESSHRFPTCHSTAAILGTTRPRTQRVRTGLLDAEVHYTHSPSTPLQALHQMRQGR